jgi:hypothetical protein
MRILTTVNSLPPTSAVSKDAVGVSEKEPGAYHEAGHAVMAWWAGFPIANVSIWLEEGGWNGEVERVIPEKAADPHAARVLMERAAMMEIGGIVARRLFGLAEPSQLILLEHALKANKSLSRVFDPEDEDIDAHRRGLEEEVERRLQAQELRGRLRAIARSATILDT